MASVQCGGSLRLFIGLLVAAAIFATFWDGSILQLLHDWTLPAHCALDRLVKVPLYGLLNKPNQPTLEEVVATRELNGRPLAEVQQDDPLLVDFIRQKLLVPPSGRPYNLRTAARKEFSQVNQTDVLLRLMSRTLDLRPGFFVECGAFDGETFSNTLYFEREHGWSGLLVEPDPANFCRLVSKNRRSHAMRACLSTTPHPTVASLVAESSGGGISQYWSEFKQKLATKKKRYEVLCVPLYSALLALNTTTVDYFSLDVEGAELPILKTVPFDKVDIKLLSIEYGVWPVPSLQYRRSREAERKVEMNDFFTNKSSLRYKLADVGPFDLFFVKLPQI